MSTSQRVIHYDDLPQGGFAGILERHMVLNPELWPKAKDRTDISHGLVDFIYLALGQFLPNDGAPMHPHHDVDIVSVVFSGSVGHKGTLGDGTAIHAPEVQVQRAGTGMQHAEFNLHDTPADIAQIWFKPPEKGLEPAYKNFKLSDSGLTTVLGGTDGSFISNMVCKVGYLPVGEEITVNQPFVVLITQGKGNANGVPVTKGDLIEGDSLQFIAGHDLGLALIHARY
ncbi:pirin family protein [Vibrio genomosp. F10]|uniref:pirin family protein n=1 Tax=Vibrio genomosp. F10 TaxID=723171 RepID=UPI0002D9398A|nr:pirin family protein [Vibrio genomosp. F10]OEE96751.1 Pirin-like protein [Vibrio genomosp. F10 str. 9ZD137]